MQSGHYRIFFTLLLFSGNDYEITCKTTMPYYFVVFSVEDFSMTSNVYNKKITVPVKLMLSATVFLWEFSCSLQFFVSQNANLFVSSWVKDIHYHGVLFKASHYWLILLQSFQGLKSTLVVLFFPPSHFNPLLKAFITLSSCQSCINYWHKYTVLDVINDKKAKLSSCINLLVLSFDSLFLPHVPIMPSQQ